MAPYSTISVKYTLNQLLDAFKPVAEKLQVLRNKLPFPNEDARHVGLYGMQEVVVAFGLTVHAVTGNGLRSRQRNREEVVESFENYVTIEGETPDQMLTLVETVWRLSLLTLVHFKMDSLFQNLLTALGATPGKTGFAKNLSDLTSKLTLADPQHVKNVLNTPTLIRNSLHNNGIHRGPDWGPINIHGLTYEFRKGKDLRCASFGHVLAALDASVDALESILLSPEIKALPRVEDLYTKLNRV